MKILFGIVCMAVCITSCFNNTEKRPTSAAETGTSFIRATLDGDFKTAETLLLKEDPNEAMFESYKTFYKRLSQDKKKAYKNASYTINTLTDINDSTTIINYSNSFMKEPMNIKVKKRDNLWCVDFKYTSGDSSIKN